MKLHEMLERVDSKETFLAFVEALCADWHKSQVKERFLPSSPFGPDSGGWENPKLGSFLEAMHAWSESDRVPLEASWRVFAEMLYAGKIYE